jgi:hypothetical protein
MLRRYLDTLQAHNTRIISAGGGGGSTGWALTGNASAVTDFLGTTNNRTMRFRTNNVERMVIDSIGRVGIGTATPTFGLDVNGNARVRKSDNSTGSILEVITQNLSAGMSISYEGIEAIGAVSDLDIKLTPKGTGRLTSASPINLTNSNQIISGINIQGNSINANTAFPSLYMNYYSGPAGNSASFKNLIIADGKNVGYSFFDATNKSLSIGKGENAAVASSILELSSTTKGLLIPRMTLTQRNAIASPAAGLQVYNTTTNTNDVFNGTTWAHQPLIVTNRLTANYTLDMSDIGDLVELNVGTANTLTVPLNSVVAFPIGSKIDVAQYGAGQTTITAASGVTIRSFGGALKIAGQYGAATLVKIGTNEWYCFGNLSL